MAQKRYFCLGDEDVLIVHGVDVSQIEVAGKIRELLRAFSEKCRNRRRARKLLIDTNSEKNGRNVQRTEYRR